MTYTNLRFANELARSIQCSRDGVEISVPVDPDNADYAVICATGATVAAFLKPVTAADVRTEASRRIQLLVGARDASHLEVIIANGSREAIRLLRIKTDRDWTKEEAVRAAQLGAIDTAIEAIRAASNAMESAPPDDFADDANWPTQTSGEA